MIILSMKAYLSCLHRAPPHVIDLLSCLPLTLTDIQGMIVMCPFFDNVEQLTNFKYTLPCVTRIGKNSVTVKLAK
jgi:hypothetical protein